MHVVPENPFLALLRQIGAREARVTVYRVATLLGKNRNLSELDAVRRQLEDANGLNGRWLTPKRHPHDPYATVYDLSGLV